MAKPALPPLTDEEIRAFASKQSSFSFEMAALRALHAAGYACRHSATYVDPITGKIREFDIRARRGFDGHAIRLAVECKQLSMESPLIVFRTDRGPHERYHTTILRQRGGYTSWPAARPVSPSRLYPQDTPVGRMLEQPRRKDEETIVSSDSATFEKWSQALNGVFDEVRLLVLEPLPETTQYLVVPVLVVPDGTLFAVDFDDAGAVVAEARTVVTAELFVGHTWTLPTHGIELKVPISHINILTLSAVTDWAKTLDSERSFLPSD